MVVKPISDFYALEIRKKLGFSSGFGFYVFSRAGFAFENSHTGIFQRRVTGYNNTGRIPHLERKQYFVRMRDYAPTNPRTVPQQANRTKFAQAVESWQGLTNEQKANYNAQCIGKPYSGYHLYIREQMNAD